ncbi:hypothetical protein [Legionella waltersii]|uniref:hypothetical protein n=1 Tax=Legionella waltersii TaxID=66969 RepID=UPI0012EDB2CE|nr:hypothetical protein [Legionella waltersii]
MKKLYSIFTMVFSSIVYSEPIKVIGIAKETIIYAKQVIISVPPECYFIWWF